MFSKTKIYLKMNTLFAIAAFIVSADVFLVLNLGGFSIRMAQLLLAIPILFFIANTLYKGECRAPVGYVSLLLWFAFLVIFIPHTTFLLRNVSYVIWMLFNILLIFAAVQFINNEKKLLYVFKAYLYSFMFVGTFGILQFALSVLRIPAPLVTQFWPNGIARINGFSYEPSYFATYMVMGWVLVLYLKVTKTSIVSKRFLNTAFGISTISLILSTSRMGLMLLALWILGYVFLFAKWFLKAQFHKTYFKIILPFFLIFCSIVTLIISDTTGRFDFLLSGTGLKGTPSHSVESRNSEFENTFQVFLDSPIIGYSLGGIAPAIGKLRGIHVIDQNTAKANEGMSVFIEVLAASGVIGFIPFVWYISALLLRPLRLAKRLREKEMRNILMGLTLSLIAILIILQFNQNISRLYLWFHIALLSSAYSISSRNVIGVKASRDNKKVA